MCESSQEPVDLKGDHFSDSSRCQALQSLADEERDDSEDSAGPPSVIAHLSPDDRRNLRLGAIARSRYYEIQ